MSLTLIESIGDSVEALFNQYDVDQSGSLDRSEIIVLLNDLCMNMALPRLEKHEIERFYHVLDEDGDDEITVEELELHLPSIK